MIHERKIGSVVVVMLMSAALLAACGTIDLPCLSGECPDSSKCGNGVVDSGETCDIAVPLGQPGACPVSCGDGNPCTSGILTNPGTCTAKCMVLPCVCGNGVVDAEETCDTAIPAGQPGACPTSCTPSNKCHTAKLVNGGTCKAVCQQDVITPCCGNGIVEPPEECDPPTVLSTCFDDCRKGAPCERAGGKCVTDLGSGCGAGQPIDVACLPEGVYPEVPVICCIYIVPFPLQQ